MIFSSPGPEAHELIRRLSHECLGIVAVHGGCEKEDVVHGVVTVGGGAVGLRISLRVADPGMRSRKRRPWRC